MNTDKFYINGTWVAPAGQQTHAVINPATEEVVAQLAMGNSADVDAAVAAAKAAFAGFSQTSVSERRELLADINAELIKRNDEIAAAITSEMGAPVGLSRGAQAPSGRQHFGEILNVLDNFEWTDRLGKTQVVREPIGVCALITPWNWPMNQMATKVAPALAAGCTMILKPSENAPLDAIILTEILHSCGVPKGVFNLIHGDGIGVGAPLTSHKGVDMVSFTGSTRAGIAISQSAAPTIKRVALELGGKSPSIVLDDCDLEASVKGTVSGCMGNTGQSCNAPTIMFVPARHYDAACEIAATTAKALRAGDPNDPKTNLGPIANRNQYEKVKALIQNGLDDGAKLIAGGDEGLPEAGYFIAPTVFANVTEGMSVFQEEIFGPVICLVSYSAIEEAIALANKTEYGLSSYVWGRNEDECAVVARQIRAGMVHINGASLDAAAPFGGYKMSGNGREWGVYGLEEFLETKSIYSS
ncbi:MAG: aldehyde dehydrogenase family protein [Litorimonas sp.]